MYTPPGTPRSRSFTRLTMRVGLEHLGQSVLLVVSISFLRSAVLAILAIVVLSVVRGLAPMKCQLAPGKPAHRKTLRPEYFPACLQRRITKGRNRNLTLQKRTTAKLTFILHQRGSSAAVVPARRSKLQSLPVDTGAASAARLHQKLGREPAREGKVIGQGQQKRQVREAKESSHRQAAPYSWASGDWA